MNKYRLSRRTVLRGTAATGIAIALPRLEAMQDSKGRLWNGQSYAEPNTKLITFFSSNGFPRRDRGLPVYDFVPKTRGRNFEITPCLEPLADFKSDFSILLGFSSPSNGLDSHASGTCAFATGTTASFIGAQGPSVDQVGATLAGGNASLVVAVGNPGGDSNGHSSACFSNISWVAKEQPAAAIRNPVALFTKLFGSSSMEPTPTTPVDDPLKKKYRTSVLDYVLADINRLRPKLGSADKLRLDAHLASVDRLHKVLQQVTVSCTAPTNPTKALTIPNVDPGTTDAEKSSYQARLTNAILSENGFISAAAVQAELFGLAFKCDAYRSGAFMCANSGTEDAWDISKDVAFPGAAPLWPGHTLNASTPSLSEGERMHSRIHDVAATTNDAQLETLHKKWIAFTQSNTYMLRRFLLALKGDGAPGVLDNSIVYFGPELGYGPGHSLDDYVYLVAGRGGGLKPGNFIEYANGAETRDLLFTLLKYAGLTVNSFAGSNKLVAGLDT